MAVQLIRDQQGRVTVRDPERAEFAQLMSQVPPQLRQIVERIVSLRLARGRVGLQSTPAQQTGRP